LLSISDDLLLLRYIPLAHLYTSFWSVGHLWQGADEKIIDSPNGVITDLFIL